MLLVNGSNKWPFARCFAKARFTSPPTDGKEERSLCVVGKPPTYNRLPSVTREWPGQANLCLATSWILSQVKGKDGWETDPVKVRWCFLSCNVVYTTGSGVKLPWRYLPLLTGHTWLCYSDVRGSCHVLGVINHQRPLKCPQTHFWSLLPEDDLQCWKREWLIMNCYHLWKNQ